MSKSHTRRRFLAAGFGAGLLVLRDARIARSYRANERLNLAVFGSMYNAQHFLHAAHLYNAHIVAICNPDQRQIAPVFRRWDEVARQWHAADNPQQRSAAVQYRRLAQGQDIHVYADVRRMFDQQAEQIDAVVVSHYDHLHGVACGLALRAGKPVCSERPLGLTIRDARELRSLAAETRLPTTYRSPGTGSGAFRRAMELVAEGAIGAVREVHIWFRRGGPDRTQRPQGAHPIPDGLEWDLWLGPLAWREYHPDWMSYANWRETSNGGLGSFGPHTAVFPFLVLQMPALWQEGRKPELIRVEAECSTKNRLSFPSWERVCWQIPARGEMPPVNVTWHHGPEFAPGTRERLHAEFARWGVSSEAHADDLMRMAGSLLVGETGALVGDDHSMKVTLLPADRWMGVRTDHPDRMPASRGIYADWIEACRGGSPQILADFDCGGALSQLLMLGNIATAFPGETLTYDTASGQITDHEQANRLRGAAYRSGWQL